MTIAIGDGAVNRLGTTDSAKPSSVARTVAPAEARPEAGTYARFHNHGAADLRSMLDELELVAPGVCEARGWVAGTGASRPGGPCTRLPPWASRPGKARRSAVQTSPHSEMYLDCTCLVVAIRGGFTDEHIAA